MSSSFHLSSWFSLLDQPTCVKPPHPAGALMPHTKPHPWMDALLILLRYWNLMSGHLSTGISACSECWCWASSPSCLDAFPSHTSFQFALPWGCTPHPVQTLMVRHREPLSRGTLLISSVLWYTVLDYYECALSASRHVYFALPCLFDFLNSYFRKLKSFLLKRTRQKPVFETPKIRRSSTLYKESHHRLFKYHHPLHLTCCFVYKNLIST